MSERKKERFNKGDIFIGIMNTIIEIVNSFLSIADEILLYNCNKAK
jgi:hypothetical protein